MNPKDQHGIPLECPKGETMEPDRPSSATDSQSAPDSVAESVPADPATLQNELAALKHDYLRLAADFDNFRKRTPRDTGQQAAAEKESVIRDLLPVLDNLERALASE